MTDLTPQTMAVKLLAEGFTHAGPDTDALSDPLCDTSIVVTLDELRPYELNPRITRNPLYDEIKSSIRERGLDAPPPITRRPGADHYIIRNGGNTRLSILRELWSETKEERFFRISCLFRPWPERGEIVALTGHLVEHELHGGLSFIERALGVEKARELYEQESSQPLSQRELARRLSADGYPVAQPHISRMQDTVRYLLPAIPNVLYGGLGRPQVERLTALRRAGEAVWERRAHGQSLAVDFETLFHEVLSSFDLSPAEFVFPRVKDELIGQMADLLGVDYNHLDLNIEDTEDRQNALMTPPRETADIGTADAGAADIAAAVLPAFPPNLPGLDAVAGLPTRYGDFPAMPSGVPPDRPMAGSPDGTVPDGPGPDEAPLQDEASPQEAQARVASPTAGTERLQTLRQMVAEQVEQGGAHPDFAEKVLRALPIQADGLYPISDIWQIEPSLDTPECLRVHIAQYAREIAGEAGLAEWITPVGNGIGFVCSLPAAPLSDFGRAILGLLSLLSGDADPAFLAFQGEIDLASLLRGRLAPEGEAFRLSDDGLVKLFRLLRLARRLLDIEAGAASGC